MSQKVYVKNGRKCPSKTIEEIPQGSIQDTPKTTSKYKPIYDDGNLATVCKNQKGSMIGSNKSSHSPSKEMP